MSRAPQRVFGVDFKLMAIGRMSGGESVRSVGEALGVLGKDLYRWRAQYRALGAAGLRGRGRPRQASVTGALAGLAAGDPPPDALSRALLRIAELERKIGQQQVDLDFFRHALRQVGGPQQPPGKAGATASTSRFGR